MVFLGFLFLFFFFFSIKPLNILFTCGLEKCQRGNEGNKNLPIFRIGRLNVYCLSIVHSVNNKAMKNNISALFGPSSPSHLIHILAHLLEYLVLHFSKGSCVWELCPGVVFLHSVSEVPSCLLSALCQSSWDWQEKLAVSFLWLVCEKLSARNA